MVKVEITVVRKCFFAELAEEYLTDGREAGPCPLLNEGDTFVYEGGAMMPEGFCPWAWIDVYRAVSTLSSEPTGNHWYRYPDRRVACCTDGVRPVVFVLRAQPEEAGED
jgi:uncharacterized repeat protein (TIGR04076 family)